MSINLDILGGHDFEDLIEQLLIKMGFTTEGRKPSADGGIDIVAVSSQPLVSGRYIIQCKRYSNSVSSPIIRDLYGVVTDQRANKGILITTSTFTSDAVEFAHDKPIELIDGNKLIDLLRTYSLLTTEDSVTSQIQTTSALLRNEISGLSDKFQNQLVQADTRLILNRKSFGNENQMSTYKSFGEWTSKLDLEIRDEVDGIKTVSQELLQFQNGASPDLSGARRIRTQLEELFQNAMSLYEDVQRTAVPSVATNYHRILIGMVRADIAHYIDFVKRSEDALEKGMRLTPYEYSPQGVVELKQAIEEMQSGIRGVFRGAGRHHRIQKLNGGQFKCSCGLFFPDRKEALEHIR